LVWFEDFLQSVQFCDSKLNQPTADFWDRFGGGVLGKVSQLGRDLIGAEITANAHIANHALQSKTQPA
jgi:hypothetical protein